MLAKLVRFSYAPWKRSDMEKSELSFKEMIEPKEHYA